MKTTHKSPRLAVLIDADNTSPKIAEALFDEIAKIGEAGVRRIYGDFTSPHSKNWNSILAQHGLIPQQQFAYTKGKNATDIALVIDAMDLLYKNGVDGFCLVSSDSDFTRLASRIREESLAVYGFGEEKTPESFRSACTRFIYTSNLAPDSKNNETADGAQPQVEKKHAPSKAVPLIRKALAQANDEDGWANLGEVGSRLQKLAPDFDERTYGCSRLSELIEKSGAFENKKMENGILIRLKQTPAAKTQK